MRPAVPLSAVLLLVALAAPAQAWVAGEDRPHHADLAVMAAERLPPQWRDAILEHEPEFRKGAMDPDLTVHTFYHTYEPYDDGGGAVWRTQKSLHEATMAMREGRPPEEVAYQLGFLTHFILDLSMPMHTGDDDYDNPLHERYEHAAYDHRAELDIRWAREPGEVGDVGAYSLSVAEQSALMADALIAALPEEGEAWSPEAARITGEAASLGVEAAADLLYTAFALADPARPDPPRAFENELAVPKDAEDLGLSITELGKYYPMHMLALASAMAAAAVALAAYFLGGRLKRARSGSRASSATRWRRLASWARGHRP